MGIMTVSKIVFVSSGHCIDGKNIKTLNLIYATGAVILSNLANILFCPAIACRSSDPDEFAVVCLDIHSIIPIGPI